MVDIMAIHTRILCRICNDELIIGETTHIDFCNITHAKFKNNGERRCNNCRKQKPVKGTKTLYIQSDGSISTSQDPDVKYGLDADDITPDELDNPDQLQSLFNVYENDMGGDLDKKDFTVQVQSFIHGNGDKVQFDK